MQENTTPFSELSKLDVSEHTEKKKAGSTELTYLSWPYAWAEVQKHYPDATYSIKKDEKGLPYVYDERTGYMVYTAVTIEEVTHEMWLPVMDGANKAMKAERYTYKVRDWKTKQYVDKTVEPATMFDINKTLMRCLVKNLAMFGLGLYIYAGEDLPISDEPAEKIKERPKTEDDKAIEEAKLRARVLGYINRHGFDDVKIAQLCKIYKVVKLTELTAQQCQHYIAALEKNGGNIDE